MYILYIYKIYKVILLNQFFKDYIYIYIYRYRSIVYTDNFFKKKNRFKRFTLFEKI